MVSSQISVYFSLISLPTFNGVILTYNDILMMVNLTNGHFSAPFFVVITVFLDFLAAESKLLHLFSKILLTFHMWNKILHLVMLCDQKWSSDHLFGHSPSLIPELEQRRSNAPKGPALGFSPFMPIHIKGMHPTSHEYVSHFYLFPNCPHFYASVLSGAADYFGKIISSALFFKFPCINVFINLHKPF